MEIGKRDWDFPNNVPRFKDFPLSHPLPYKRFTTTDNIEGRREVRLPSGKFTFRFLLTLATRVGLW